MRDDGLVVLEGGAMTVCDHCYPPGFAVSEGDQDDHIVLRRGEVVRVHLTNGTAGNADVLHVGREAVRLDMRSIRSGDKDVTLPADLASSEVVVPWTQILSLQIDPIDPWPDERRFLRKMARKYPQHFSERSE